MLRVTITNDAVAEANETITVTLVAPAGWTLGTHPTFTLTILDDGG
jgi:hypothetical protein